MSLIKIINPFSFSYPSIKNFGVKKEFFKLTPLHKSITIVASSIFTLLTLGLGTRSYLRKLVGRFRKLELNKAVKIEKVAIARMPQLTPLIISTPAAMFVNDIPQHAAANPPSKEEGQLVTHPTGSDGSCALHALLGVPVSGVYKTDASAKRKALCEWLEKQYSKYQMHERAYNVLQDYFDHFTKAPETFRKAVHKKYEHYRREFDKSQDPLQRSDIRTSFIYDPVVFHAYCSELKNVGRYMLQDELIMAAECFGCQLELHQPVWNEDAGKGRDKRNAVSEIFNASAPGKKIHIWYNGSNHYERAEIIKQ